MNEWTGGRPAVSDVDADDWIDAPIEAGRLVLPAELQPSIDAFTIAATQWRWASVGLAGPMGGLLLQPIRVGLDYAGLGSAWSLSAISPTPELFADVRLMEAEALVALSEERAGD